MIGTTEATIVSKQNETQGAGSIGWHEVSIGQIASVVTKGTTPTTYGMPFVDSGINFVKAEALNGESSLDHTGFSFIDESTHEKLARSQLQEHDVLVTIAGANVGKCGFVRAVDLPANTNQAVGIIRVNQTIADPRFIYYHFKLPSTRKQCLSIGGQAAQPNVNLTVLKSFTLRLPKLSTQIRIASILSAYDDLIENNRRRIQLLELSIQSLYNEWFIQLRFPSHEHVKIKDDLPEGWEDTYLPDVIDVNPPTPIEKGREVWYVPMSALSQCGMTVDLSQLERRTEHTAIKFQKNDVLLARITPCLENGKTGLVYFLKNGEVACGSTEFIVLRGMHVSCAYTYCLARSYAFRENAIKSMIGSSGRQRVQTSCFNEYKVPLPPKHLLDMFDEIAYKHFDQIRILMAQNYRLVQARDLLLPRLMSGEVAV